MRRKTMRSAPRPIHRTGGFTSRVFGAHVVALTETLDRETKRDAAVLAVHHSKVPESHKMTVVDVCRVRGVSKRAHSAYGLVDVSEEGICELTVFRNKAVEKARLGRLLITKTTAH